VQLALDLGVQFALRDETHRRARQVQGQGLVRRDRQLNTGEDRRAGVGARLRSQNRARPTIRPASIDSPPAVYEMGSTFKSLTLAMALTAAR